MKSHCDAKSTDRSPPILHKSASIAFSVTNATHNDRSNNDQRKMRRVNERQVEAFENARRGRENRDLSQAEALMALRGIANSALTSFT